MRELLEVRGHLTTAEWELLIEELSSIPYHLNSHTAQQFAYALVNAETSGASALISALRRAGAVLQSANPRSRFGFDETFAFLIVALALLWLEDEVSSHAERLFLLALPNLLLDRDTLPHGRRDGPRLRAGEVVSSVWPLLERVPASRIQHCLGAGMNSRVPEVRACCRVLAALTGTQWPEQTDPD